MSSEIKPKYYFAYGSNMLSGRFFVSNKGNRHGTGILKDYMIGFNKLVRAWNGGVATILKKEGSFVEGCIWEVDQDSLKSLDDQEENYHRITVDIKLDSGEILECETYEFDDLYMMEASNEDFKYGLLPSTTYVKVIVIGAIESNLSKKYIDFLRTIKHNGKIAEPRETDLKVNVFQL